tara:strand:- start:1580 stop:1849 length:270 start_codon:yes stop_codon:yes gene_type:complete
MIDQHDVEMMIRAVIDSEDTIADSIDDAIDVRLAQLDIDNVIEEMIQSVLDDQDEPIADLVEEKVNMRTRELLRQHSDVQSMVDDFISF